MLVPFPLMKPEPRARFFTPRYATLLLWSLWAWTVMTITHEVGHVVAGLMGGGALAQFEIRPWHLPHSLLRADPYPLVTLWAGPVFGCAAPMLAACAVRRRPFWFVAWFCLLANASYLLIGYFSGQAELDSTKMLAAGTPPLVLVVISLVALTIGYWCFRRVCIELLADSSAAMTRRQMRWCATGLVLVVALQTLIGSLFAAM